MKLLRKRSLWMVLFLFMVLGAAGCEEEVVEPTPEPSPYADLTEPEHVIQNLLQCYKDRNSERYCELLMDPEYLFYLQARDVGQGEEPFWNLQQDYDATRRMFLAAIGAPENQDPLIDRLELTIGGGTWTDVDSIGDEPCLDCQYTERIYTITAVIGETTYLGEDQIIALYVEPVEDKGITVFKIRRWYDLPK